MFALVVVAVLAALVGRLGSHRSGVVHAPERGLVGIVWACSAVLLSALVLGSLHLFSAWAVAGGLALEVAALAALGRRATPATDAVWQPREPPWLLQVGGALAAAVAVQWSAGVLHVLGNGMTDADSQHYHLSQAARFVQTGAVLPVRQVSAGDLAAYHPSNDELVRAVGMSATGTEFVTVAWGAVVFALVVLAALTFGRRVGRPGAVLSATSVVLALPGSAREYMGSAANDWTALGFLVAAVALLATGRRRLLFVAGLALGWAMGTKLTVLAPAGAVLVAALVVSWRRFGLRAATTLLAGTTVTGAWWFLRNWFAVGTPVPGLRLPGLQGPTAPLLDAGARSVLSYATDVDVIRTWFVPGLQVALGPAWWVVLLSAVVGVVVALRSRDRSVVAVAVLALVALIGYLITPTGAAGTDGQPVLFQFNVRYAFPALVLAGWAGASRAHPAACGAVSALLVGTTLAPEASWATRPAWLVLVLVLAVAVVATVVTRVAVVPPRARRVVPGLLCLAALAVLAGPLTAEYVEHRYSEQDDRSRLFALARDWHERRVGVVGMPLQYGFTGDRLSNRVDYLGRLREDGAYVDLTSCSELVSVVADRAIDVVAVLTFRGLPPPPAATWLRQHDGFDVVRANDAGVVFVRDEAVGPEGCAGG